MDHTQILLRPVVTEKATFLRDGANQVAFFVHPDANKIEIKKAVEEIFGVKVQKVNTVRMQGKMKRTGAYPQGRRPAYKKAMVQLTADSKTIEFFEGMV